MGKKKLTLIPKNREEWLEKRISGLGGSEIAAILGLNPYKASIEVFREKVGVLPLDTSDNTSMFMGRYMEDHILNLWQYWEGSAQSVVDNFNEEKKIQNYVKVNHRIVDEDYPHLFAHLDGLIAESEGNIYDRDNGILEAKNIRSFSAKKWEHGIPSYYVPQYQTYLLITGLKWGQIVTLVDGVNLNVIEFEEDLVMQQEIIEKTATFWDNVLKARKLIQEHGEEKAVEMDYFKSLEPKPDGSEAWEKYLKTTYKTPAHESIMKGSDELLYFSKNYNEVSVEMKYLEEKKRYWANEIRSYMKDCEVADFGVNGKVTWKKQGKSRVLRVGLKQFDLVA